MRHPPYSSWLASLKTFDSRQISETRQLLRFLKATLRRSRSTGLRLQCAYHCQKFDDPGLQSILCARASDPAEHPLLRGLCLERLDTQPRNRRQARQIRRTLLSCLRDPDPNVRFWACFKAPLWALPILQQMTQDQGVGDLGQTVGVEATQAIRSLRKEPSGSNLPQEEKYPPSLPHPYGSLWAATTGPGWDESH